MSSRQRKLHGFQQRCCRSLQLYNFRVDPYIVIICSDAGADTVRCILNLSVEGHGLRLTCIRQTLRCSILCLQ